jgi:hypothetical protein
MLGSVAGLTRILASIEQGEPHAAAELLPLVYDELRRLAVEKMAQEQPGQTLQATALVHEAYLRLPDVERPHHRDGRRHVCPATVSTNRQSDPKRPGQAVRGELSGMAGRSTESRSAAMAIAWP